MLCDCLLQLRVNNQYVLPNAIVYYSLWCGFGLLDIMSITMKKVCKDLVESLMKIKYCTALEISWFESRKVQNKLSHSRTCV